MCSVLDSVCSVLDSVSSFVSDGLPQPGATGGGIRQEMVAFTTIANWGPVLTIVQIFTVDCINRPTLPEAIGGGEASGRNGGFFSQLMPTEDQLSQLLPTGEQC